MTNLLIILLVLALALIVVVAFTEKYAKPMDSQQQSKLARIAMVLIMVLLIGRLLQHYLG